MSHVIETSLLTPLLLLLELGDLEAALALASNADLVGAANTLINFFLVFLGPRPQHMEVSRLGV